MLSDKIEELKFIIKFECYKFNKVKWEFQYSFDQDIKLFSIVTKQNKNMHTTFIFILTGKVNVMICTLQFIIEEIYVGNDMGPSIHNNVQIQSSGYYIHNGVSLLHN